uniref:Patatin-like phospholipase n=1 Tax=uncultured bacterium contig00031 TaxID=1181520 RepID=A0A806KEE5_9BACT|nr:patatin-like phospholipase [uncultured bacterium contig00031]
MESNFELQECGLVLEGGGLRGNYTAGVLDAFLDAGIYFPYVIGVSAGACMGISYISRQRGRNFQILQQFHGDPRYFSIRNLLTTRSIFGKDFLFNQLPNKYIPFDWKTFIASPARFTAVCTCCETGEPEYFEKQPGMEMADYFTAVEASASMPYTSNIVGYKGKKYLDGAITDAIPLKKAEAEGYKRNVVVLTNPAGFRKKDKPHPPNKLLYFRKKNLISALETRVARYNQSLEYVEAEGSAGHAIIIRPSKNHNVGLVEKDKEKLIRLYELGISDTKEMLTQIANGN